MPKARSNNASQSPPRIIAPAATPSDRSADTRQRAAIDASRTGDKVAASDPAIAPLGTDAEAGGETSPVLSGLRPAPRSPGESIAAPDTKESGG